MRIALTGASGIVGGFALRAALAQGHEVTVLDRASGYVLGDAPDLAGHHALIHCAFAHVPGRYRGGEGADAQGFRRDNLDGSIRLFDAAAAAGVGRILFLSSRAVHDGHPPGIALFDDLPPRPANLYGEVKALAEAHLRRLRPQLRATSIRATGIYGPGPAQKWRGLIRDYLAGRAITPRVATELHGRDLACAMLLLLTQETPPASVNASDLVLDRRDLLAEVRDLTSSRHPLPHRADASLLNVPDCAALAAMGWRPGGMTLLRQSLPRMLADP
ncbi:MAG: NAD-dependent epimerase/dehydratase family protein [Paracoccus sp. (in: a-proteobacteria)]|uniref:NAD-dependent epimerase/dehydratase family protein n=1 Tax=unclassified Paracoccus (in: a-proteobacteria) TaxID=2688777 RepID=UPI0025F00BE5|nr:NAD(P)-dependent oxidoreductase [Paracoccus sp. UBA889]MCS5601134.1 NAD(P)-dependent oxidoreductase [Paracoccus sp. (in: a-proteobacteria)]|tara:strand:- start:4541 stop:5362 length:822 start_codon:yes stop_codon:yes gene_type:complete